MRLTVLYESSFVERLKQHGLATIDNIHYQITQYRNSPVQLWVDNIPVSAKSVDDAINIAVKIAVEKRRSTSRLRSLPIESKLKEGVK